MKIAGFVKTTLQDWEGKNSCMILISGCNFKCPYCNRPDLIEEVEEGMDLDPIVRYIRSNKDFLDAVVISGGEPTAHDDLYKLLKDLKQLKVKIKLDTNGSNPDMLDDLIGAKLVDKVCINIMAPFDDEAYSKAAGVTVDVDKICKSLTILAESGIVYEIRTVIVPGRIDHGSFGSILKSLDGTKSLIIQQFDPKITLDPTLNVKPYPKPVLIRMAETAKGYVKRVRIRGF